MTPGRERSVIGCLLAVVVLAPLAAAAFMFDIARHLEGWTAWLFWGFGGACIWMTAYQVYDLCREAARKFGAKPLERFYECPKCGHGNPSMSTIEVGRVLFVRCDQCDHGFNPPEAA